MRPWQAAFPLAMERTGIEIAIDFHDEPFYGKGEQTRQVTVRGQAKKGTTHFVSIATAYVIWRQVRLTLAVRFVLPGESALESLEFLLECLKKLHFSSKVLYLDKDFASTSIIRFLDKQKQPAILACPIRGKTKGIRVLCHGSASYRTVHTFSDGTQAALALKASLVPDKTGKRRRKWLAFIALDDSELSLTGYGIPGRVIHTPGHSAGSVCVLLNTGEVFAGDMAVDAWFLRWTPGLAVLAEDRDEMIQSWKTLLQMGARRVYPAHGRDFPIDVIEKEITKIERTNEWAY